jgi:hypothetical protein
MTFALFPLDVSQKRRKRQMPRKENEQVMGNLPLQR